MRRLYRQTSMLFAVGFSVVGISGASAQQDNLVGLKATRLLVEDLDEDSRKCGLAQSSLKTAAAKVLLDNRIEVSDIGPTYLYVRVGTLSFPNTGQCVSAIDVDLYSYLLGTPRDRDHEVFGKLMLVSKRGMSSTGRGAAAHGEDVFRFIQELATEIAVEIRLANQPKR